MLISGLLFLCLHKLIFSLKNLGGRKRIADYLGSLKKLVRLFGVLEMRKLLDMSTPVLKVKEPPPPGKGVKTRFYPGSETPCTSE